MSDIFVMLDLETLGNRINPVIVQVSAVAFTLEDGCIGSEFNSLVDRSSCENIGLELNESTLQWWSEQSDDAKAIVFDESAKRDSILACLHKFHMYLEGLRHGGSRVYLWGNGVRADNVWLLSAYKAAGMDDPIGYNEDLDYRTLHYLSRKKSGIDFKKATEFKGVPHNAIDDCKYQIECAKKMWAAILG